MASSDDRLLSRRKWMGAAATASLGTGLLAVTAAAQSPKAGAAGNTLGVRTYNIRDFGAKGDGATLDTAALQAAIDICAKEQGGTVLVPAGVFVIGTVEMKSNVTLHISAGGKLLGSADGRQYHAIDAIPLTGDHTLNDGNVALIFAVNARNVRIEGPGTIDGQGAQFRSPSKGVPPPSGIGGSRRPYHMLFYRCEHLAVRDIFLTACAFHSVRIIKSKYVNLDGIHIHNRVNSNNDGFHFVSAEHVHLSNCTVECQDDACALFGSCKFITVTNCSFSTRWSVFRFGGGEAENITVSNCLIYDTFGCPIKLRCSSGSRFENISFSNLVMKNVTGPISIGLGPQPRRADRPAPETTTPEKPGIVRNISFSGIHATVVVPFQLPDVPFRSGYNPGEIKSCMALNGMNDGFIENVSFNDVHVTFAGGGTAEDAAVRDVPKVAGEYYQAGVYPAYALFARNVKGLTLNNIRFEVSAPELRPAMVFDTVEDVAVSGFSAQGNREAESLLRFIGSRDVLLSASRLISPASVFLQVEGAASGGITIDGGDLSKAAKPLAFAAGAKEEAVKLRS
ncbi:MAG TPA: glycosyl hydrolase family 28 protein [Clostridia bacterium]|nr:glycosyl hydrolase family 28 protein [Clostridia bacterium]